VAFGRKDKRANRTFKRTPVWMRSEEPEQIWEGGLRELRYLLGSLRLISATRHYQDEHPLSGHDLSYEERCAVGAADAFAWLSERGLYLEDSDRLASESQTLADAFTAHDFDGIVKCCNLIATDLDGLKPH
jgi:hypothetical protein